MSEDLYQTPINGPRRPAPHPRQRLPPNSSPSLTVPSVRDTGAYASPDRTNAQSRPEDESDEDDDDTIDNHQHPSRSVAAETEAGAGRPLRPLPLAPRQTPSTTPVTSTFGSARPGILQQSSSSSPSAPRAVPTPPRAQPPVPATPRRDTVPDFRSTDVSASNTAGYPSPSREYGVNPDSPQGSLPPPYSFEQEPNINTPSPTGRPNHHPAPYPTSPSMSPSFSQSPAAQYLPSPSMSPSVHQLTSPQSTPSLSASHSTPYSPGMQNSPVTTMSPPFSHSSSSAQYSPLASMSPSNAYALNSSFPLVDTALNDIRTGGRITEAAFHGVPPQPSWNTMLRRPEDGGYLGPVESGSAMQHGPVNEPPRSPNVPLIPNRRTPLPSDLLARSSPVTSSPSSSAYSGNRGNQSLVQPHQPSPLANERPPTIVLSNGEAVTVEYVEELQAELEALRGLLRDATTAKNDIGEDYNTAGHILDMIYTGSALDGFEPELSLEEPCELEEVKVNISSKCRHTPACHDGLGKCTRPPWRGVLTLSEIEWDNHLGYYSDLWHRARADVLKHIQSTMKPYLRECKRPWRRFRTIPGGDLGPLPIVGPLSHQHGPPR